MSFTILGNLINLFIYKIIFFEKCTFGGKSKKETPNDQKCKAHVMMVGSGDNLEHSFKCQFGICHHGVAQKPGDCEEILRGVFVRSIGLGRDPARFLCMCSI